MTRQPRFAIIFASETLDHVAAVDRKYHGLIERIIGEQLGYTPEQETRNRKLLEQPVPLGRRGN